MQFPLLTSPLPPLALLNLLLLTLGSCAPVEPIPLVAGPKITSFFAPGKAVPNLASSTEPLPTSVFGVTAPPANLQTHLQVNTACFVGACLAMRWHRRRQHALQQAQQAHEAQQAQQAQQVAAAAMNHGAATAASKEHGA